MLVETTTGSFTSYISIYFSKLLEDFLVI